MSSRRKVLGSVLAAVAAGGAAGAVWLAESAQPANRASAAPDVPTGTAPVTRATVAERVQVNGTFGYGAAYPVVYLGEPGVLTAITGAEIVVARGAQLYAVAGRPVRLLYGSVPAYRGFAPGMSDGPDVRQLEENLVALGLDPGHRLTVDEHFSAATAAAILRWQTVMGLPSAERTGTLPLGRVVFQPGALRINGVQGTIGAGVHADQPVLTATPTTPVITAQVSVDRRRLVHPGDPVTVTMTGSAPFAGTVLAVAQSTGTGQLQQSEPQFQVTIAATPPAGAADLDQAPVVVAVTRQTHPDVLAVPVTALLARPGGGYQVRLASDRYVQVEPGLFDSVTGQVEVTGALSSGQQVQVPVR